MGVCFWACALGLSTNLNTKLDVFGVRGIGGLIGTIFAGVLAAGALSATAAMRGGIFGLLQGNPQQLLAQFYGIGLTLVWTGIMTSVILDVVGLFGAAARASRGRDNGLD